MLQMICSRKHMLTLGDLEVGQIYVEKSSKQCSQWVFLQSDFDQLPIYLC